MSYWLSAGLLALHSIIGKEGYFINEWIESHTEFLIEYNEYNISLFENYEICKYNPGLNRNQ